MESDLRIYAALNIDRQLMGLFYKREDAEKSWEMTYPTHISPVSFRTSKTVKCDLDVYCGPVKVGTIEPAVVMNRPDHLR